MSGGETEPVNHMLALHRSLTSSLYKNRLQASSNMWSCIIVTLSALVGGGWAAGGGGENVVDNDYADEI